MRTGEDLSTRYSILTEFGPELRRTMREAGRVVLGFEIPVVLFVGSGTVLSTMEPAVNPLEETVTVTVPGVPVDWTGR